jgi:glucan phosphoethanolaminetransferase (alkaline phosphatase superfamily)
MGRIYLLWWAFLLGVGLTGILVIWKDAFKRKTMTKRIAIAMISLLLVGAAVLACPAMLFLEYDGITSTQTSFVISWLLHMAAAATLVSAFKSSGSKRAKRYLDSR